MPCSKIKNLKEFLKEYYLLLLLIVVSLWLWHTFYTANFDGKIQSNDVHVYMDAARNFSRGDGFTLNFMFPAEVWHSKGIIKPLSIILHPFAILIFFHIVGDWLRAAVLVSSTFYLLTIPLIYIAAKAFFNKKIALITALIFAFDTKSLFFSLFGIADPLFTFLLILCIYVLYKSEAKFHFLLAGFILGLCSITRQAGLLFFIPFALYLVIAGRERKARNALLFTAGYALVLAMSSYRSYMFFGNISGYANPSGAFLAFTSEYPERAILKGLGFSASPIRLILSDKTVFLSFATKCFHNLEVLHVRFFTDVTSSPYLAALFFGSLFSRIDNRKANNLRLLIAALMLVQLFYGITVQAATRYFYPFTPFMMLFGVWFLLQSVEKLEIKRWMRQGLIASTTLLILYPFSFLSSIDTHHFVSPCIREGKSIAPYEQLGDFIQQNIPEKGVIFTDAQWLAGWYGERKAIMLPKTIDTARKIDKEVVSIDGILLTPLYIRTESPEWQGLYYSPEPFGEFLSIKIYYINGEKYVLYKKEGGRGLEYYPSYKKDEATRIIQSETAGWRPDTYIIIGNFLRENTEESDIIITEEDWLVEWYGRRVAIRRPLTLEMTRELERSFPINGIFLTSLSIGGMGKEWRRLLDHPAPFGDFVSVKVFYINDIKTVLYRKKGEEEIKTRGFYEVEKMYNITGRRRIDPQASNKMAVYGDLRRDKPDHMIFGQYDIYPPGEYRVKFRLKTGDNTTREKVAVINICTDKGRRIIAERALYGCDFNSKDAYQDFELAFSINQPGELEFRVYFTAKADLWADNITVEEQQY